MSHNTAKNGNQNGHGIHLSQGQCTYPPMHYHEESRYWPSPVIMICLCSERLELWVWHVPSQNSAASTQCDQWPVPEVDGLCCPTEVPSSGLGWAGEGRVLVSAATLSVVRCHGLYF